MAIVVAGLGAIPAAAEDLAALAPPELLSAFRDGIASLTKTENLIAANGREAERNRGELEALNRENARLSSAAAAHNAEVAAHNRAIEAYTGECLGKKLPEDAYTACFSEKSKLDAGKETLDTAGEGLARAHGAYNRNVAAFNAKEAERAGAASALLASFRAADEKIRFIQVRLYELAAATGDAAFAERNRQCTQKANLDQVYVCFAGLWR